MSFQEFQKAPNRLTSRDIGFLIAAGIVILLVLYGLWIANSYLANLLPDGGEFYLLRTSGHAFLFDRIEPYSANVPERVQELVYGRPASAGETLYILDIPFHLLIFFFPLALIPDAVMARAVWMAFSEIALAGFLFLGFRSMGRKIPWIFITLISIVGFSSFYAYRSLLEGSPVFLLALAYVGIIVSLRVGLDELAGALLALSAFQWEVGGLFLLFVVVWVYWEQRWRVFAGAGMLTFILLMVSFLWYPGWAVPFFQAAWNSFKLGFGSGYSARVIFSHLWPQYGSLLAWVLTAVLIMALGYEWRAARRSNFNRFVWAACFSLAAAPLLGYPVKMDQLLPLTLPLMLIIVISRERWRKLGNGIAFLLILFFFGIPWLLQMQGVPEGFPLRADEILFLFWPVLAVIGLYWVRWWMIRPPRTWLDRAQQRDSS